MISSKLPFFGETSQDVNELPLDLLMKPRTDVQPPSLKGKKTANPALALKHKTEGKKGILSYTNIYSLSQWNPEVKV